MLQLSLGQKDTLQNRLTKTLIPITSEVGGGGGGAKICLAMSSNQVKLLTQKYL